MLKPHCFLQMQYGDLDEFEACFVFACPKFLSPVAPTTTVGNQEDCVKEAMKFQTQVFMDEVRQQKMIPTIRRYKSRIQSMYSFVNYVEEYCINSCKLVMQFQLILLTKFNILLEERAISSHLKITNKKCFLSVCVTSHLVDKIA